MLEKISLYNALVFWNYKVSKIGKYMFNYNYLYDYIIIILSFNLQSLFCAWRINFC